MLKTNDSLAAAIALMLAVPLAGAQTASTTPQGTLRSAVEQAVTSNPEVTSRFNALRASGDAVDVARGAFFPKVDLEASGGRSTDRLDTRSPQSQSINRTGVALNLTQLLWDGLGTQRDVERLGHDRLARYFELIDATEATALEAARAHYDVQRYRRLVALAEDNYVQHRYAMTQIRSRFRAGVGRGVDLEQANARVALAESNLASELSNLHDVSARYLRVVGSPPPAALPRTALLAEALPATPDALLQGAIQRSAAVSASIENLRAARSAAALRESAFQPRVEARVRAGGGNNYDGIRDQRRDASAQIVLNWNLFNGGSDAARVRQQKNLVNQAQDLRDKACRDTRQNASIAFNETRKLREQLDYLDRNTIAIEKARDAYRQQFDIGQRSLLDLLNAENELYTARRAYANADFDLSVAFARAQASLSQLTTTLGIARFDATAPEAPGWAAGDDAPGRCPVLALDIGSTARSELDARADRMAATAPPLQPAPTARPAAPAPAPSAAPVPAPTSAPRAPVAAPTPRPAASGLQLLPRAN